MQQRGNRPPTKRDGRFDSRRPLRHPSHVLRRDWKNLASHVVHRRVQLGYRDRRSFSSALGISDRTIGNLERGQSVSSNTLAAVELLLKWKPGSTDTILRGGEPAEVEPEQPEPTLYTDEERELWSLDTIPTAERLKLLEYLRSLRGTPQDHKDRAV